MEKIRRLTINREGIGFFKAILESYEEVALMTVLDGRRGEIELIYPDAAEDIVEAIMDDMGRFNVVLRDAPSEVAREQSGTAAASSGGMDNV